MDTKYGHLWTDLTSTHCVCGLVKDDDIQNSTGLTVQKLSCLELMKSGIQSKTTLHKTVLPTEGDKLVLDSYDIKLQAIRTAFDSAEQLSNIGCIVYI